MTNQLEILKSEARFVAITVWSHSNYYLSHLSHYVYGNAFIPKPSSSSTSLVVANLPS